MPTIKEELLGCDHICEDCKNHFKSVLEFIDEMGVPYFLDIRLVRG